MACLSKWVFIIVVILGLLVPFLEGRMLMDVKYEANSRYAALRQGLLLSALPMDSVPSSSPSKKGHTAFTEEELIVGHLVSIDRIMRSVPSPGAGH